MPVLAIVEMEGDTEALTRASEAICDRIGMAPGLLARVIAPTETGIVLVNVWASEEARQASQADPVHAAAIAESGLAQVTTRREGRFLSTDFVQLAAGTPPALH
jgi:hypothetical protein